METTSEANAGAVEPMMKEDGRVTSHEVVNTLAPLGRIIHEHFNTSRVLNNRRDSATSTSYGLSSVRRELHGEN